MRDLKVLGVTGGTATGKSVVCRMLRDKGGKVIDADLIAKKSEMCGGSSYEEIIARFGVGILDDEREIDRKMLGDIVFGDPEALRDLNAIVHKHVAAEIKRRVQEYRESDDESIKFIVLDVPIPIEDGFFDTCDYIWAVTANDDIRVARLMRRMNITEDAAAIRIAAQWTNREYAEIADCELVNEGSVDDLKKLVDYEYRRFREICG
ncbi:MAG: dephospho-CoA kinase [Clostridia bacterium]|nr:dephospho-CoA kinase [Clostridia bacterium]MBO7408106.1 dephospho-CoA kinase [Clostridia bacterium]MBP5729941.1 dephospho-CoA kinase [Clostridia bacterium]